MIPTPPELALQRGALATLAEQLASLYAERIRAGSLAAGTRLPSVRGAAKQHALAPSTVVAAYDLLQAQGLVEARQQRGFFVRAAHPAAEPARHGDAAPRSAPPHDVTTLMRGMFEHQGGKALSPGIGTLPPDWLDLPLLHGAMRRALSEDARDPTSLRYGEPAGDARLRTALSLRLGQLGISTGPAQIVTTVGATHALDIVSHLFLSRRHGACRRAGLGGRVRTPGADGRQAAACRAAPPGRIWRSCVAGSKPAPQRASRACTSRSRCCTTRPVRRYPWLRRTSCSSWRRRTT